MAKTRMHCHAVAKKNENGGDTSFAAVESQPIWTAESGNPLNWLGLIKQEGDLVVGEGAGILLGQEKAHLVHAGQLGRHGGGFFHGGEVFLIDRGGGKRPIGSRFLGERSGRGHRRWAGVRRFHLWGAHAQPDGQCCGDGQTGARPSAAGSEPTGQPALATLPRCLALGRLPHGAQDILREIGTRFHRLGFTKQFKNRIVGREWLHGYLYQPMGRGKVAGICKNVNWHRGRRGGGALPEVDHRPGTLHIVRQMISRFLLLFSLFALLGCESGEPGAMSLDDMEGPEGEAMVRHLLKTLPPLDPQVPKVYSVVKGERLYSTSMKFVGRMDDLKLNFVSGEVLTMRDPDKSIVDPRSGLSPVTLQLTSLKASGTDRWDVVAGWAYKKLFERSLYRLEKKGEGYEASLMQRIEGNYVKPDEPVPAPAAGAPATPAPAPASVPVPTPGPVPIPVPAPASEVKP